MRVCEFRPLNIRCNYQLISILHTHNTIESLWITGHPHIDALRPSSPPTSTAFFCPSDTQIALEMLGCAAAVGLNAVACGVPGIGARANPGVLIHLTDLELGSGLPCLIIYPWEIMGIQPPKGNLPGFIKQLSSLGVTFGTIFQVPSLLPSTKPLNNKNIHKLSQLVRRGKFHGKFDFNWFPFRNLF